MEIPPVNFEVIEETLERRLSEVGLEPSRNDGCVETGLEYLHLHRDEMHITYTEDVNLVYVSLGLNAVLKHEKWGDFVIPDFITVSGNSPENAFIRASEIYMDVTFPALHALFDEKVAAQTDPTALATLTYPEGQPVFWRVFTGRQRIETWNGELINPEVSDDLPTSPVMDTLNGVLKEPRLHWCKLYVETEADGDMMFGVSIDGEESADGANEMFEKFEAPSDYPDEWEMRQFFVFIPDGEHDKKLADKLERIAKKQLLRERPRWWRKNKRRPS